MPEQHGAARSPQDTPLHQAISIAIERADALDADELKERVFVP